MGKKRSEEAQVPFLRIADVGALIGLSGRSVGIYLTESRPGGGGRYVDHPFPAPDGYMGRVPYWLLDREPEIIAWNEGRVGPGIGGGRPRIRVDCPACGRPGLQLDDDGNVPSHRRRLVAADGEVGFGAKCPACGKPPRKARKAAK